MLEIHASGTPREIGLAHGAQAKTAIHRTKAFYTWKFADYSKLSWAQVQNLAIEFQPIIARKWPLYLEEMSGIAEGSELELADIIALNVRTEIAFGLFSDGCTALSWGPWLAQNWDWDEQQKENLVNLTVDQAGKPTIKMITEAGILGKIGLNSAGVGVCLNAIKAKGMDPTRLPCHMGLRMVLESESREEAVSKLEKYGIASACHMLVGDKTGAVGLEWSSVECRKVHMNAKKQVFHANHYLVEHAGQVEFKDWIQDSTFRTARIEDLAKDVQGEPTYEKLLEVFKDTERQPRSICRSQTAPSESATLFNIIMNLEKKRADVIHGKPNDPDEHFVLSFEPQANGHSS